MEETSQVSPLQFIHGMTGRSCGECHIGDGGVLAGGGRHTCTVRNEDIRGHMTIS